MHDCSMDCLGISKIPNGIFVPFGRPLDLDDLELCVGTGILACMHQCDVS